MRGRMRYRSGTGYLAAVISMLVGLFLGLPSALYAQESASITGRVEGLDGLSVRGAVISAINQEDGKIIKAKSDRSGHYTLSPLQPGIYLVAAEMAGLFKIRTTHGPVTLTSGDKELVDFRLPITTAYFAEPVVLHITLEERIPKSDAVAYVIIEHIDRAEEWKIGTDFVAPGHLISARPIEQIKTFGTRDLVGGLIQFLHIGTPSPHKVGQEYVCFLTWNETAKHFTELHGDSYMVEIANSRVLKNAHLKDVRVGMPVDELLERLRSLTKLNAR